MKQRQFLVTGATGKTGVYTIDNLLAQGYAVRALVRTEDERSAALKAKGVEIVVGNLLEHDDVIRATQGVNGAYLCYPVRPGYIQATAYFADAARRAGLEVVVEMSQISAREDSKSHAARDHWIAERVLDWSGVPAVHIRPTFFSEWLTFPWVRDKINQEGKITLPYGEGRHAAIAAEDQARFIAAVLADPAGHIGKTYTLCGPVEMNQQQIADEMSRVLGRKIVYAPFTMKEYEEHLKSYELDQFLIQHFMAIATDYQNGIFAGEDQVIEKLTGKAPQTVAEYVNAKRELF